MILVRYTSDKILKITPERNLLKIKNIFGIDTKLPLDKTILKNNIDKYSEPVIDEAFEKIDKGYSSNDNDSLDRLFNIENDD